MNWRTIVRWKNGQPPPKKQLAALELAFEGSEGSLLARLERLEAEVAKLRQHLEHRHRV